MNVKRLSQLKTKVFILLLTSTILTGGIVAGVSYVKMREVSEGQYLSNLIDINYSITSSVEAYAESIIQSLEFASKIYDKNQSYSEQGSFFKNLTTSTKSTVSYAGLIGKGLVDVKGKLISLSELDIEKRDWYQCVKKTQEFCVSTPYKSINGNFVIAWSHPLKQESKLFGMINLNKDMNELSQLVTQSIKNNQYRVSTFRSDGFIIANSKLEYIGKNIFTLYGGSLDKYTADLNRIVDIDGFYNYTSYEPNANMYINISISKDYIYSQARNSAIISIFIAIVSILIVLVFTSYFLKKQLATPLAKITGIAEKITAGNLNNDIDLNEFHPDEIGYLANSFYEMQSSLSRVITSSASISNHVASSSEELIVVMKKTAQNTQNELAQMEEVSTAISELSSTAREVSSNAVQAEDETRKAIEFVNSGHKALEQSIALTTIINSSVKDTADLIEALKNSSVDIGEVTHVISSISEQINLLALNAAIEAARAGEHGRGFAVVADEVRVLASKTQESTKNIQEIISSLQVRSEDANRNMISNVTSIQESVDLSVLVKASFEDISHSVQVISDINALVATASQEQYSVTEDIAKNTTRTFDLVNDNVTAVNQTQQAAQELAVLADKQNQELSFFKLSH